MSVHLGVKQKSYRNPMTSVEMITSSPVCTDGVRRAVRLRQSRRGASVYQVGAGRPPGGRLTAYRHAPTPPRTTRCSAVLDDRHASRLVARR